MGVTASGQARARGAIKPGRTLRDNASCKIIPVRQCRPSDAAAPRLDAAWHGVCNWVSTRQAFLPKPQAFLPEPRTCLPEPQSFLPTPVPRDPTPHEGASHANPRRLRTDL